jgi:hypothetical protein
VAQRILEQHVEDLADQTGRGEHGLGDARRHHHLSTLLGEPLLPVGDLMVDERREVDLGAFLRAARAGHAEQLVQRRVQLVGLCQCGRGLGRHLSVTRPLQQLEAHRDAGQPGAQLVGGVGREATFGVQHAVDPVRAEPERAGDRIDLLDARRLRRGCAEVAVTDP